MGSCVFAFEFFGAFDLGDKRIGWPVPPASGDVFSALGIGAGEEARDPAV
jgi:hypothetical protein